MTRRTTGHKIALGFAILCLLGMLASLGTYAYFHYTKGMMDVLTGSALATIFFFASCAFVLYYISRPPKHELLPWDAPEP